MSQDFFADLERQLVAAAGDRRRRLRRARARRAAALSTTLVAVLAAGAGLAAAVTGGAGGGGGAAAPAHHVTSAGAGATTPPAKVAPALDGFTTAVLNGTATPGLARGVATRLADMGAKIGNVTNAGTQHISGTRVYAARRQDATCAILIAERLGLRKRAVDDAPASLRALAGEQAKVIVVVGADQDTPRRP
jgi:hypothetical protein